jgi:rfaE bifunctional protein kinase chain/domain/rfaE bifunctional protein nucleotidyltransferase chain/domain
VKELSEKYRAKIKTPEEVRAAIGARPRDRKVIMCHGTFDVVHPGHIRHLLYAKSKGDVLVASLTCDHHVMKGHSNSRPFVPEDLRAINLAAFEMVDYVVIDREPTPLQNIALIQPDYFAKGYEYTSSGLHPRTRAEKDVIESYGGEIIFTPGDIVYSSTALLDLAPPNLRAEKLTTLMKAEDVTFHGLRETLDKFSGVRVHVVGDTIVDSYSYCTMIGGMTKTPTPSVLFEQRQDYTGGAAIVAKHLRAAGADVTFSTVLGKDALADHVIADLAEAGVACRPIIDATRPTTNKNAFIAGGYRMLKVDTLDNRSISERTLDELTRSVRDTKADAVVFSDFRHGIFNKGTVPALIDAIPAGAFRVADSQVASRWGNILEFQEFDLITPNEREARFSLGDQDSGIRPLAATLYERARCKTLILKLGDRGIITYRSARPNDYRAFFVIDSFADRVVDAVGAGDALLAYATLSMAVSDNVSIASILGSLSAAIECEHEGNVPVALVDMQRRVNDIEAQCAFG